MKQIRVAGRWMNVYAGIALFGFLAALAVLFAFVAVVEISVGGGAW